MIKTASVILSNGGPSIMRTRQSLPIRLPYEFATSITVGIGPSGADYPFFPRHSHPPPHRSLCSRRHSHARRSTSPNDPRRARRPLACSLREASCIHGSTSPLDAGPCRGDASEEHGVFPLVLAAALRTAQTVDCGRLGWETAAMDVSLPGNMRSAFGIRLAVR